MCTLTFMRTQNSSNSFYLFSRAMRKQPFTYSNSKAQFSCVVTAQLICGFLYFRIVSTNSLLHKSVSSSLKSFSVAVQLGLCWTWSETLNTGFLTTQLIFNNVLCHRIRGNIFLINYEKQYHNRPRHVYIIRQNLYMCA